MNRLRTLEWGDYPGLSVWAQCNHKGLHERKGKGMRVREGDLKTKSDAERRSLPRECEQLLEAGKGKGIVSPLKLSRGDCSRDCSFANTLILSLQDSF